MLQRKAFGAGSVFFTRPTGARSFYNMFGSPIYFKEPKTGSGIEGPTKFDRNVKTWATAADYAATKPKEFHLIEKFILYSAIFAVIGIVQTKWDHYVFFKENGHIYEEGLSIFHYNKDMQLKKPIEGLPR